MTLRHGSLTQLADYSMIAIDSPDNVEYTDEPVVFANGLARVSPTGGALIATGCYMGPVHVEWTTGEKTQPSLSDWDDIVQIRVHPSHGELIIRGFMESGEDGNSPNLALSPDAPHILRCSARGRDDDTGAAVEHPVEEHRIEVWLATADDKEEILKTSSTYAQGLMSSAT